MTTTLLLYFLSASVALTVAPGPDNLFVVAQGISRGRKVAVVTAWGMCSGIAIHTLAAAAGISALFYSSALAFQLLKYAGVAYLLYLAFRAVRENPFGPKLADVPVDSGFIYFQRGFIMNVLNPKVALFFLAFLPQFTVSESGHVGLQMIALGLLFMLQAVVIFTAIGFFSGSIGRCLNRRPLAGKCFSWLSAGIFASLGIRLAMTER